RRLHRHREPGARPGLDRPRARARLVLRTRGAGADGGTVTIFTHVLATTLGAQALELRGGQLALAYAFGVGVDIDHAIKAPFYLRAVGFRDKRGYYWRSSLQEPVALLWIVPLSVFLGTIIPVVFFVIHVAMDYSVRFEKMPFYPYSSYVTRGWLLGLSDNVKEAVLFVLLACTTSLLFLAAR